MFWTTNKNNDDDYEYDYEDDYEDANSDNEVSSEEEQEEQQEEETESQNEKQNKKDPTYMSWEEAHYRTCCIRKCLIATPQDVYDTFFVAPAGNKNSEKTVEWELPLRQDVISFPKTKQKDEDVLQKVSKAFFEYHHENHLLYLQQQKEKNSQSTSMPTTKEGGMMHSISKTVINTTYNILTRTFINNNEYDYDYDENDNHECENDDDYYYNTVVPPSSAAAADDDDDDIHNSSSDRTLVDWKEPILNRKITCLCLQFICNQLQPMKQQTTTTSNPRIMLRNSLPTSSDGQQQILELNDSTNTVDIPELQSIISWIDWCHQISSSLSIVEKEEDHPIHCSYNNNSSNMDDTTIANCFLSKIGNTEIDFLLQCLLYCGYLKLITKQALMNSNNNNNDTTTKNNNASVYEFIVIMDNPDKIKKLSTTTSITSSLEEEAKEQFIAIDVIIALYEMDKILRSITNRIESCTKQLESCTETITKLNALKNKNKSVLVFHLKKKKLLSNQLDIYNKQLLNLEISKNAIMDSYYQKHILNVLQITSSTLKELRNLKNVEDIDDMMEDMREDILTNNEIHDSIAIIENTTSNLSEKKGNTKNEEEEEDTIDVDEFYDVEEEEVKTTNMDNHVVHATNNNDEDDALLKELEELCIRDENKNNNNNTVESIHVKETKNCQAQPQKQETTTKRVLNTTKEKEKKKILVAS